MARPVTRGARRSALLAASLAAAAVLTPAVGRPQAPAGAADSAPFVSPVVPQPVATIEVPIHPRVAAAPDGRFFAALQTRPDPALWIVPVGGGAPFPYRKIWAAYNPRWSPSGDRIGFLAAGGPPRIWTIEVDPATGRPTDPPRLLYRTAASAFAFSPDGSRIAFVPRRSTAAGAGAIHIVDWESRKDRFLLRERGVIYRLDWSPDGKLIYYGVAPVLPGPDSTHRVMRARVSNGNGALVLRTGAYLGLSPDGLLLLCRAATDTAASGVYDLITAAGRPFLRLRLPGPAPAWGPSAASLVQVAAAGEGYAIRVIPTCPGCFFAVR